MSLSRAFCSSLAVFSLLDGVHSQSPKLRAETAMEVLKGWYNTSTGLFETTGWWNSGRSINAIANLAAVDPSVLATATDILNNTFVMAPAYNPHFFVQKTDTNGVVRTVYPESWPHAVQWFDPSQVGSVNASAWLDGFYDDDAWWALAWISAYDLTQNANYLRLAEGIFEGLRQGWPTNCSQGGIWWTVEKSYVNAIANELFLAVAAKLANRAQDKAYYLDWAKRELEWFRASGMINADYNINDGLSLTCENNGEAIFSYNQGVILGALVELNKASPDPSYLGLAAKIAEGGVRNLTDKNMVIRDPCEPDCQTDGNQFKGIFIRNLQVLHSVAPQKEYAQAIEASARSIWDNDRNSANMFSEVWAGPFVAPANATTQTSALEALTAHLAISGMAASAS